MTEISMEKIFPILHPNYDIHKKSDKKAEKFRKEGNILYQQRNFFTAIVLYNKSLCFSVSKEQISLSYANRSAAYMETKMYDECLTNIWLALQNSYPENLRKKLEERQSKCLDLMEAEDRKSEVNPESFLKLSHDPNPKIPFIVSNLVLKTNSEGESGVFAKKPLKVGDIISIEDFQTCRISYLDHLDGYKSCSSCPKTLLLNLIPCGKCNHVMFCSLACQKFHDEFECAGAGLLGDTKMHLTFRPVKVFHKMLSIVDGSIDELEEIYEDCKKNPKKVFDFDFSNPEDPEFGRNEVRVLLSLRANKPRAEFKLMIDSLSLTEKFVEKTKFVRSILLHLVQVLYNNEFSEKLPIANDAYPTKHALVMFAPLLKHSCSPNVEGILGEEKFYLVVSKPIAANEEITYSYEGSFFSNPIETRQHDMSMKYRFWCKCEACKDPERYEIFPNLKMSDNLELWHAAVKYSGFPNQDTSFEGAAKAARKIANTLQSNYEVDEYPNWSYVFLWDVLTLCLKKLSGPKKYFLGN